jgi:hypothetical protein
MSQPIFHGSACRQFKPFAIIIFFLVSHFETYPTLDCYRAAPQGLEVKGELKMTVNDPEAAFTRVQVRLRPAGCESALVIGTTSLPQSPAQRRLPNPTAQVRRRLR